MSLTVEDAQSFCRNILRMRPGLVEDYSNRLDFLSDYVKSFHTVCPFTNMWDVLAKKLWQSEFAQDTVYKMTNRWHFINRVLTGQGGTCESNSIATKFVLTKLGFKTKHVISMTRNPSGMEMFHFVNIVSGVLHPDDTYLVDVGSRIAPLFQPVPLNSLQRKSNEVILGPSAHVQNKVSLLTLDPEDGHKLYRRFFKHLNEPTPVSTRSVWTPFYDFDETDIGFLYSDEDCCNVDYRKLAILVETKLFKRFKTFIRSYESSYVQGVHHRLDNFWTENIFIIGFPSGKPALFSNNKALVEMSNQNRALKQFSFDSLEELISAVHKWYPRLNIHYLRIWLTQFWHNKYQNLPLSRL